MVGRRILGAALGALLLGTVSVSADTIKVGVIGPFSGPFALQGKNFQAGIEAYHGAQRQERRRATTSR